MLEIAQLIKRFPLVRGFGGFSPLLVLLIDGTDCFGLAIEQHVMTGECGRARVSPQIQGRTRKGGSSWGQKFPFKVMLPMSSRLSVGPYLLELLLPPNYTTLGRWPLGDT